MEAFIIVVKNFKWNWKRIGIFGISLVLRISSDFCALSKRKTFVILLFDWILFSLFLLKFYYCRWVSFSEFLPLGWLFHIPQWWKTKLKSDTRNQKWKKNKNEINAILSDFESATMSNMCWAFFRFSVAFRLWMEWTENKWFYWNDLASDHNIVIKICKFDLWKIKSTDWNHFIGQNENERSDNKVIWIIFYKSAPIGLLFFFDGFFFRRHHSMPFSCKKREKNKID